MLSRFKILASVVLTGSLPGYALDDAHKQGSIEIPEFCSVNLDQGKASCLVTLDGDGTDPPVHPRGMGFDFWYQADGKAKYVAPQNGAVLALGDLNDAGFTGCSVANFSKRRVRVDLLSVGTHICVRNKAGRIAEIQLERVDPKSHRLPIAYVTWTESHSR